MTGAAGEAMQGLNLEAIPFSQGMTAAAMGPAALRQGTNLYARGTVKAGEAIENIPIIKARTEATAAKNLSESYKNAAKIEAAQLAEKHNVLINPDISNPTAKNRIKGAIAGDQNVSEKMAEKNQFTFNKVAREDVGIPETKILNAKTFDEAHAAPELTAPYERAKSIPKINIYDDVLAEIDSLKTKDLLGDTAENAAQLNKYIDDVKAKIAAGGDGNLFVDSARQLRKESQDIYSKQHAPGGLSVTERNLADAKMGLADAVESLILDSLPLKDRNAFLKAREQHAKLYTLEQATNLATGQVEPKFFAKMIDDRKPVSGNMRDLGLIVANNPDIAGQAAKQPWSIPRITRATLPGLIGGAVGTAIGGPFLGGPIGLTLGTAAGGVGRRVLTKICFHQSIKAKTLYLKTIAPSHKLTLCAPSSLVKLTSYRLILAMRLCRLKHLGLILPANKTLYLGLTLLLFTAQRGLPNEMPKQLYEAQKQADLAQGFREADERAPTRGGIAFDLDPITGRLVNQSNRRFHPTPSSLQAAVTKLSSGQPFALQADELAAWNYTKTNIGEVLPGFKNLSDKVIAERMMDRAWVADAVKKARQKAQAFDELAKRSQQAAEKFEAQAQRERMLDLAEELESRFTSRPDNSRKGQGPKTREAIRNRLVGGDNFNNLRE